MKKFCFLALNAAVFFSSLPAKAADSYLQDEIDQIKSDIVVIQRQLYREKSDTTAPKESVSNFQVRLGEYDRSSSQIHIVPAYLKVFDFLISIVV